MLGKGLITKCEHTTLLNHTLLGYKIVIMNIRDISRIISNWNNEEIKELVFSLSDRYSDIVEDINAKTKTEGTGYIVHILKQFQRGEYVLKQNPFMTTNEDLLKELKESLFIALQAVCIMNNLEFYPIQHECGIYLCKHGNAERLIDFFGSLKTIRKYTKELKKPFLSAFELGGVVHNCIDYIEQKYDLGCLPNKESLQGEWADHYNITLPYVIRNETMLFDDCGIDYPDCPLIDEIRKDLSEINDTNMRQRYLYSLITPFQRFSNIYHPTAVLERYDKDIKEDEKVKEDWSKIPLDKQLYDVAGKPAGTPKEQIKACEESIDQIKKNKERTLYINRRFIEITCTKPPRKDSVEYCLRCFCHVVSLYANKLDALLLENGIDLMQLQKDCGVYLKDYRCITDVDFYIGSEELAKKYINALPKIKHHTAAEEENERNKKPANTNNYDGKQENFIPTTQQVTKDEDVTPFSEAAFEELKYYFNSNFLGLKNGGINWFGHLEADIKKLKTKRELAAIALMIKESDYARKIPSNFTNWLSTFLSIFRLGSSKYRPSHLRTEIELMKKKGITYL